MSHTGPTCLNHTYSYLQLVLPAARVLFGIPSSAGRIASILVQGIRPAPRVLNPENIPTQTPFVLVMNHYERPGLAAWWGPIVALHSIWSHRGCEPRDLRMTMVREWWYLDPLGRLIKQPLTRWFFGRLARAFGLVLLPPVLEGREFRGEGLLAIRHALALTLCDTPQLVGLAPEGRTGANGQLCKPPKGTGRFLLMLTHDSIPCLPAGIYLDAAWQLTVNFGTPFLLDSTGIARDEQDRQAATEVMLRIGRLLPESMWGAYRSEIDHAMKTAPA